MTGPALERCFGFIASLRPAGAKPEGADVPGGGYGPEDVPNPVLDEPAVQTPPTQKSEPESPCAITVPTPLYPSKEHLGPNSPPDSLAPSPREECSTECQHTYLPGPSREPTPEFGHPVMFATAPGQRLRRGCVYVSFFAETTIRAPCAMPSLYSFTSSPHNFRTRVY